MERDNVSSKTQDGLTRRGVMRKGLIASGATLGVGAAGSRLGAIGGAAAIPPIVLGAAAGGAAIGYLAKKGADLYLGDSRDYSGYTGGDALHKEVYAGSVQMESANERVMTSIGNNVNNSKNIGLAKGKAAILTAMNAGKSQSEANNDLDAAIDGYYSTVQENIITHSQAQLSQAYGMVDQVANNSNLSVGGVFTVTEFANWGNAGSGTSTTLEEIHPSQNTNASFNEGANEYQLLDGSTISQDSWSMRINKDGNSSTKSVTATNSAEVKIAAKDPDSDSVGEMYNSFIMKSVLDDLVASRDDVKSQLSGFVSDVYAQYEPGDIPTEDIVDPITAATELNQNYDGQQAQGAFASMMGIPTSAEQSLILEIHRSNGDVTIQADIYTDYTPSSGSFETGTRYTPANWNSPLYIAYEFTANDGTEQSDFVQLEDPFTVVEATNANGEDINTFAPETQNNQTADITALEEELAQIREEQNRLQNEAEEEMAGGGGGFLAGSETQNLGILAGAAALAALLFGRN